ncbi:MAG: low molecular weight protein-tyrosine-phosphatase [Flavobacteriaceae bacterium]|jgi:protein-tyrosine phosphatase|nr:low molecular weight phosphotyrosine protein phosphatase [Bacteroidota bacterium]|tara:strand:+ start:4598 stop:5083 length:486 start_codon:yes stop_codon:yes gene_type:complete
MKKTNVLMVCLGNICRSPLAEGILKSKLNTQQFYVTSAGTGPWHVGNAPDPRSIEIAQRHNLDITDQRGRQFSAYDFEEFDHIYVMDKSNFQDVVRLAHTDLEKAKVSLLLDVLFPNENVDVPDPYYGGKDGFSAVYDLIDQACERIAEDLNQSIPESLNK